MNASNQSPIGADGQHRYLHLGTLLLAFLLAATSCKKPTEPDVYRVTGSLSVVDVVGAQALVVADDPNAMKYFAGMEEGTGNVLLKITADGVVQEVNYWRFDTLYTTTDTGVVVTVDSILMTDTILPYRIFDANADYLIACFNKLTDDEYGYEELEYLVRKSDGAVYPLPPGYRPAHTYSHFNQLFKNEGAEHAIQRDAAGYIYYIGKGDLIKLSTQNPQMVTFQQLTTGGASGEGVSNFRVNADGHIIFNSEGISTPKVTRIRFSSGALAYPSKEIFPFWVGFDHEFYFAYTPPYQAGVTSYPTIEKLGLSGGVVSYDPVGEVNHPDAAFTSIGQPSYYFALPAHNKIVIMDFGDAFNQIGDVVAEVYNNDMEVKAFAMADLGITQINQSASSDLHYYLAGMDGNLPVLLKVDPTGFPHLATHLVPPGAYDVYELIATEDDYVIMHALRMADGKRVICQISPSGVVTEVEDDGAEIIQLVRIN